MCITYAILHLCESYLILHCQDASPEKDVTATTSPVLEARRQLLSHLPRVLASLATMWQATEAAEAKQFTTYYTLGLPRVRAHLVHVVVTLISFFPVPRIG